MKEYILISIVMLITIIAMFIFLIVAVTIDWIFLIPMMGCLIPLSIFGKYREDIDRREG